ncbi:unnamed protein product [Calypogeia fissa]
MSVELRLSRLDRVYRPPDIVDGTVVITTPSVVSHQGIRLTAVGTIMIQLSPRKVGVLEALYNSVKPIQLMNKTVDISPAGKLIAGVTELPFHLALDLPSGGPFDTLYETYHGAYVNIQYLLTADVVRGYLQKTFSATTEFIVEYRPGKFQKSLISSEAVNFYITQDTQKHALSPIIRSGGFRVTGKIATQCVLTEPVLGELVVEKSAFPVSSIDIQLLRVESVPAGEGMATERTEIQTTQIADGDVSRGLMMPIYIILPRLATCPSLSAGPFSLEFELSIMISFDSGVSKQHIQHESSASKQLIAMETIPLRLVRA